MRESSWNGRSEGMDRHATSEMLSSEISRLEKKKKNLQRGELPPLNGSEVSNNAVRIKEYMGHYVSFFH